MRGRGQVRHRLELRHLKHTSTFAFSDITKGYATCGKQAQKTEIERAQ